ncbi:MAG TPA: hypothetical protein VFK06_11170 [Candidatus Angelobacter sp.]|nr:hypothetical protein [Candidatus Angelobacter sp.]
MKIIAWSVCFLCFCVEAAAVQSKPVWDSGTVEPRELSASHDRPVPRLRVETSDYSEYTLHYQVLPDAAQVKEAWIEVWDRPVLLYRQRVPADSASGKLVWQDKDIEESPSKLQIALLDPDYKPRYICIDYCNPEDLNQTLPTSELVAGWGPDDDPPYPELQIQAVRVVAGSSGLDTVLSGRYLHRDSRLVVANFDPVHKTYEHLQFLPVEYLDMFHVKASLPPALLRQPGTLAINVMPPMEEHRSHEPVFDGTYKSWMPGTTSSEIAVVVACQQSAVVDRLEPKEVRADQAENKNESTANSDQDAELGTYLRVHGSNFNRDSQVVLGPDPLEGQKMETQFLSSEELRFWIESAKLKASPGDTVTLWVTNQKDSCAISNQTTFRVLPKDEIPVTFPGGEIRSTEPYPIPLMTQSGPREMEAIIRGTNFHPNVTVIAQIDNNSYQPLRTAFISSEELRAWLPQAMWRVHGPSFRFVIKTSGGERAVEIAKPTQ